MFGGGSCTVLYEVDSLAISPFNAQSFFRLINKLQTLQVHREPRSSTYIQSCIEMERLYIYNP